MMPWSVLTSEVTWLGKISWRLSHAVQWWSNMGSLLQVSRESQYYRTPQV